MAESSSNLVATQDAGQAAWRAEAEAEEGLPYFLVDRVVQKAPKVDDSVDRLLGHILSADKGLPSRVVRNDGVVRP